MGQLSLARLRCICVVSTALVALLAYYVYIPLPANISDPWKLMLLDATFRSAQQLSHLIQYVGLSHHLIALNFIIVSFGRKSAWSSPNVQITDTQFGGVEVRVFEGFPKAKEPLKSGVIYIHGGGWALASARISYYDELCSTMAEELNAVIISIEYRLVPQVHFPEQLYDLERAAKYFLQPQVLEKYSVDPARIAISGDSAGGNLAAALGQQFSKDDTFRNKIKLQALIYPVLQALDFNTPSYQQNVNSPILPRHVMVRYWIDYLRGSQEFVQAMVVNNHTALDVEQAATLRARLNWLSLLPASITKDYKPVMQTVGNAQIVQELPQLLDARSAPLIADQEVLQNLPKTYILTCEHDVLRDDGIMYVKRLENAGVEVTHDHFEDAFHGCMIFTSWPTNFSVGIRTRDSYIKWLKQNL
ncbi:neutral cholesterol ester hydrolase 1 [Phascolarctos cinereus]|uniref:Neutral cholesterol ester hydrolase 1 n=1 Tax=Phascolarctos cinereus TaxID=38626 RepID=A0A6P5JPM2_PHACI|nr:neutral cholesterol ester hydrolase 1 [Phascolarctos cinereus]